MNYQGQRKEKMETQKTNTRHLTPQRPLGLTERSRHSNREPRGKHRTQMKAELNESISSSMKQVRYRLTSVFVTLSRTE